ncbi:MAG: hypothetical protein ACYC05_09935 [Sulfuricella sp.]
MRNRSGKFYLLLVLAFLQCLVPFLHAHAGGLHVPSHVHIHIDDLVPSHSAHPSELRSDSSDFPVVGAATEFKRDSASDDVASLSSSPCWRIQPRQALVLSAFHAPSILPQSPFFFGAPPSQAPPAAS